MDLSRSLLRWYSRNARTFPWRTNEPDPYVVLVSETMLQQTQAARVAEALPRFLVRYPTIHALANATNGDMIRSWQGMGYNSRAIRLRDAAKVVVEEFEGGIPSDVEILRTLPGVGPYTSAAIASFAFNKWVVVLDVNVRRVYSRLIKQQHTTSDIETEAELHSFAETHIPARRSAIWHHAVMDLGSTICTSRRPACDKCPLTTICPSSGRLANVEPIRAVEPMFRNIPQRIWRGRFIDELRKILPGKHISLNQLFSEVTASKLTLDDRPWFLSVLKKLESDGLIVRTKHFVRLTD